MVFDNIKANGKLVNPYFFCKWSRCPIWSMLTREGYPTRPGGAQPKRKILGHLAIALAAFCQLEEENNLFGTHFDMQYQVHLRKHLSYSTHSASKVKDEQMAENYKAGATLPLSPLTNVPSSATKFGLSSTQLNSTPCE